MNDKYKEEMESLKNKNHSLTHQLNSKIEEIITIPKNAPKTFDQSENLKSYIDGLVKQIEDLNE